MTYSSFESIFQGYVQNMIAKQHSENEAFQGRNALIPLVRPYNTANTCGNKSRNITLHHNN